MKLDMHTQCCFDFYQPFVKKFAVNKINTPKESWWYQFHRFEKLILLFAIFDSLDPNLFDDIKRNMQPCSILLFSTIIFLILIMLTIYSTISIIRTTVQRIRSSKIPLRELSYTTITKSINNFNENNHTLYKKEKKDSSIFRLCCVQRMSSIDDVPTEIFEKSLSFNTKPNPKQKVKHNKNEYKCFPCNYNKDHLQSEFQLLPKSSSIYSYESMNVIEVDESDTDKIRPCFSMNNSLKSGRSQTVTPESSQKMELPSLEEQVVIVSEQPKNKNVKKFSDVVGIMQNKPPTYRNDMVNNVKFNKVVTRVSADEPNSVMNRSVGMTDNIPRSMDSKPRIIPSTMNMRPGNTPTHAGMKPGGNIWNSMETKPWPTTPSKYESSRSSRSSRSESRRSGHRSKKYRPRGKCHCINRHKGHCGERSQGGCREYYAGYHPSQYQWQFGGCCKTSAPLPCTPCFTVQMMQPTLTENCNPIKEDVTLNYHGWAAEES